MNHTDNITIDRKENGWIVGLTKERLDPNKPFMPRYSQWVFGNDEVKEMIDFIDGNLTY